MSDNDIASSHKETDEIIDSLSQKKSAPKIGFAVLLALYVIASLGVRWATSASGPPPIVFGSPLPIQSFAGIFSSAANFCLVFLTLFYKKPGFITSLVIMIYGFISLSLSMLSPGGPTNLPGLFSTIFALVVIVVIYISDRQNDKYQQRLRDRAITDRLTGLPNRFACSEFVDQLIKNEEKFAMISIDLNNFKSINDTMGQTTGDEVLKIIASRLKSTAEESESKTLDFVTHQGGDEFTLIIRNYTTDEDIVNTIKHYESAIEKKLTIDACDYVVSARFGYAEYPVDANTIDALFTCVDIALDEAKRLAGNERICRFNQSMLDTEHTLEVERKIRTALDSDTLFFYLQPQYDIDHRLRGFEALARMRDENGNMISPAEFIPVAEKVGLVDKIDAGVFRHAAGFLGALIDETGTDITLSVNVSVRHLMKNDFIDEVKDILETSDVPANQIEIEITESVMIDSMEKALQRIDEVKKLGVKVAIDDFGTGYSSLSYLNNFPADLLKVDKSFIDVMNSGSSSKQYVAAIISIGHIMGFDVIAEGVEGPDQIETLRGINCDFIQGFIWGRPIPPDEAHELVVESSGAIDPQ